MTRDYRITTVLRTDSLPAVLVDVFTNDLEETIYAVSANYPAVTRYIVRAKPAEIVVGLQIEKVAPENVENIANALLNEAVQAIVQRLDLKDAPQVEESELRLV